jgi:hypothetical protein
LGGKEILCEMIARVLKEKLRNELRDEVFFFSNSSFGTNSPD